MKETAPMSFSNKKVILTGGTGLIGKETILPLLNSGFEVFCVGRNGKDFLGDVNFIQGDLFDKEFIKKTMEKIKPCYLLNLAWYTTGDYLKSELNYDYLEAGLNLLRCFKENGGKRAVFAGTCFEYKFKNTPLVETDELDCEKTEYTFCKNKLREIAEHYCKQNGISFGWGRIFYVFGRGEDKTRLFGMVQNNILNNLPVNIKTGHLKKDYIYSKDAAEAFVKFLNSDIQGTLNICNGEAISVEDFVRCALELKGKENLLNVEYQKTNQPDIIVGSNLKLKKYTSYVPKYKTIHSAIKDVLDEKRH